MHYRQPVFAITRDGLWFGSTYTRKEADALPILPLLPPPPLLARPAAAAADDVCPVCTDVVEGPLLDVLLADMLSMTMQVQAAVHTLGGL